MRAATLFNFLIESTLMGSVMILLMLVVRRFLRPQLGSRVLCLAWLLVAIRLLVPLSFPNPMMNELRPTLSENVGVRPIADQVRIRATDAMFDSLDTIEAVAGPGMAGAVREFAAETSYGHTARYLAMAYLAVALLLLVWMTWQNLRFLHKLKAARVEALEGDDLARYHELCALRKVKAVPVYWVDPLPSACLVGVFRPYIALPLMLRHEDLMLVLAHELCHKKAHDHYWGLLRNACCVVHWFNPLVWLAARLSRADQEQACDERVTAPMKPEERLKYAHTLALAAARRSAPETAVLATGMTMRSKQIKRRICDIINARKAVGWLCAAALVVAFAGTLFSFGTAEQLKPLQKPQIPVLEGEPIVHRAIGDEAQAIEYAQEILCTAPYVNAASMRRFETFDQLDWEATYIAESDMWHVTTLPKDGGDGGVFMILFTPSGEIWHICDEQAAEMVYTENRQYANPSYRTHEAYKGMLFQYVQDYAAMLLPGTTLGDMFISSDYWLDDGRRCVSVRYAEDYVDRTWDYYMQVEPEVYLFAYIRSDRDAYERTSNTFLARRRARRARLLQVSQTANASFAHLDDYPEDSDAYKAALLAYSTLMEEYSYVDDEQLDRFVYALVQQDEHIYCLFHDEALPQWNYVLEVEAEYDYAVDSVSPFTSEQGGYDREGNVRYFWFRAEQKGWLDGWQQADRDAFVKYALDPLRNIPLSQAVQQEIRDGKCSPAQAVQAVFEAFWGAQEQWSPALAAWRDQTLAQFGLENSL